VEVAPELPGVGMPPHEDNLSFFKPFDQFVVTAVCGSLFILLWQPILKLHSLLTSFCWRVVSVRSLENVIEAFLESMHLPTRELEFKEAHPFINNLARSALWVLACYGALFWIFGFCGGPLGYAIQNWMMASAVDAGFCPAVDAPDWLYGSNLRIFLGSIIALYGTAPVALTAAVALPFAQPRKITINPDGMLFAQGPYLALLGRQFRLWSDLKSLQVTAGKKHKFRMQFHSGGGLAFDERQLNGHDLRVLLDAIDERAVDCEVDPQVFVACQNIAACDSESAASDGISHPAVEQRPAEVFQSTAFVPFSTGEFLPGNSIRVIRHLSSKPLCAVYLGRDVHGRMVIVKQFYLADQTAETLALTRMLDREYELLSKLDHPGIAKVIDSFAADNSTYLVIEHRVGCDLRTTVNKHGPRSESLARAWALQLCEIMIYLHAQEPPILHRDLSPDNVIAGEDGQLRLIDFGAAREFLDGITGTMIGKHCYVPPEQLRGDANKTSDIYAFGGTLYFLLTGRDPVALSQSSPMEHRQCSEEIDQLIRDCTQFDSTQRPQSFEEIRQRLQAIDKGTRLMLSAQKERLAV
jgi:hypothetical protein